MIVDDVDDDGKDWGFVDVCDDMFYFGFGD